MTEEELDMVLLTTFATNSEAELASEVLKSGGVMSVIADSETGGAMAAAGSLGGPADIFVKADELAKAKEILGLD